MSGDRLRAAPFTKRHRDGTLWAKGRIADGKPTGYWEWFRKDGTRLRSGHFAAGRQVGEWTTYDRRGLVYKVTTMELGPARSPAKICRIPYSPTRSYRPPS